MNIKTKAEVSVDKYRISFSRLLPEGVTIKDLVGYVSRETREPVFAISKLVLSNGEEVWVEGMHDMAYLGLCDSLATGQLEALAEEDDEN